MVIKNRTYHNPINQEENTPLVTILETRTDLNQSTAIDSRKAPYVIDLAKASFGGITYPTVGSQWLLKKVSGVWTLMARAPQQNPQLAPSLVPQAGDTFLGNEGTTNIMGNLKVFGTITAAVDPDIGTIKLHPSNSIPSGWLICDGAAISRVTYAPLFGVVGTTFGVGDGSTTFNIPNLKGRFVVGRDSGQVEFDTMGETGGAKTVTLTTTELPAHSHTVGTLANAAESAHTHSVSATTGGISASHTHQVGRDFDGAAGSARFTVHSAGTSGAGGLSPTDFPSVDHTHSFSTTSGAGSSHNHTISGSTASAGTGSAFSNLPPYMVLNFIIKAVSSFVPAVTGPGQTATSFNAIGSVSSDQGFTAAVNGDTSKRYIVHDDGKTEWGPGNNVVDTNLYRRAVDELGTDDLLTVSRGSTGNISLSSIVTGDSNRRFNIWADGFQEWGPGNAALDTNLYRSAANRLKTDDFFEAVGGFKTRGVEIDPIGAADGNILRWTTGLNAYTSVAEESVAMYPNANYVSAIVNSSTTSTTFVDVPNITMSWTKNKTSTKVLFQAQWTWYNTNASGGYYWAFNINSTDYQVMQVIGTVLANSRLTASASFLLSGLAAGTYTVKLRYRVAGASQTLLMDSSDVACLSVMETK